MNRSTALVVGVLLLLISVLGYVWFTSQYERIEGNRWQGFQGKAKNDKFYIAERFLREKGLEITRKKYIGHLNQVLNDSYQTLFISDTKRVLGSNQIQQLLTWVSQGHQLIVETQQTDYSFISDKLSIAENTKGLLEQAGIVVTHCERDECMQCKNKQAPKVQQEKTPPQNDEVNNAMTIDEKINRLLEVEKDNFSVTFIANHQPITLNQRNFHRYAANGGKAHKLSSQKGHCEEELYSVFTYGKGKIVVYTQSIDIFSSKPRWGKHDSIFSYNNATYLYWLLHQGGMPKHILWYEIESFPSAGMILWRYWHLTLIMALVLLLAWIWRYSQRYGTLIKNDESNTLSITRHLQATGQFYYNSEAKQTLLNSCYEQLEADIALHIPMAKRLSKPELVGKVAIMTELSAEEIKPVIYRQQPDNEIEFIQLTQLIKNIRKRL